MANKIKLTFQNLVKNLDTDYEILPTEFGTADKQIVRLYQNFIYLKFNIVVNFYSKDDEGVVFEDGFTNNLVAGLSKYDISNIVLNEEKIIQCDKEGNDKEYIRFSVSILSTVSTYQIWCKDTDTAINIFNNLMEWRYSQ